MRIVSEVIAKQNEILVRLLGDGVSSVLTGSYIVESFPPVLDTVTFEVLSENIKLNETHFVFAGVNLAPDYFLITLPTLVQVKVPTVEVLKNASTDEPKLSEQPEDTITPIRPEEHNPRESQPRIVEKIDPPILPPFWMDLLFDRANPVKLGANLLSDKMVYEGGCQGRALTSLQAQIGQDEAPYLSYMPTKVEGAFQNNLPYPDFNAGVIHGPFLDPLPEGWLVQIGDPMALLRMSMKNSSEQVLPCWTIHYAQRVTNELLSVPPVIIKSPNVLPNETFQILIVPDSKNAASTIQLKTEDNLFATPVINLTRPMVFTLNVQTSSGSVHIIWTQSKGDGSGQTIQLLAPTATNYTNAHSWTSEGKFSKADTLSVSNITFNKNWYFQKGLIKVRSDLEDSLTPISWEIKGATGERILALQEGVLSSLYSSVPVSLLSYLANFGNFQIKWTDLNTFKVSMDGINFVSIPFLLDIPIPDLILASPLIVTLKSFKTNEGSAIAYRWLWTP